MHWTQEHYKTEVMIELSTLTGAITSALGNYHSGLYSNNDCLSNDLIAAGN
jgi:leucyl aminopeptidase